MTLHAIFFYFDVEDGLTIFRVVASDFQRVLRNTQPVSRAWRVRLCIKGAPRGAP
jgi:hypothetical protein